MFYFRRAFSRGWSPQRWPICERFMHSCLHQKIRKTYLMFFNTCTHTIAECASPSIFYLHFRKDPLQSQSLDTLVEFWTSKHLDIRIRMISQSLADQQIILALCEAGSGIFHTPIPSILVPNVSIRQNKFRQMVAHKKSDRNKSSINKHHCQIIHLLHFYMTNRLLILFSLTVSPLRVSSIAFAPDKSTWYYTDYF